MSSVAAFRFPQGPELQKLLRLGRDVDLEDLFARALTQPLGQIFERPRKNLRAQLVELGFKIADLSDEALQGRMIEILEMLHAGSLVVDDIEDSSPTRRGQPSLHTLYGVPLALNAANWLYFLPFTYIEELPISEVRKAVLTRECFRTLLLAHYGQALDVGVPFTSLPRSRVHDVVLSAIELKTGVLAGFSLKLGSLLAGSEPDLSDGAERSGRQLGVALQMFDDIGNLTSSQNPGKRCEDLKAGRLSFLAAVASQTLTEERYADFLGVVDSKNPDVIADWLNAEGVVRAARVQAESHLAKAVDELRSSFRLHPADEALLKNLRTQLTRSYD